MTYRLLLRRQAKLDLQRAVRWYEAQQPGLGREFLVQADAVLDRVSDNPVQYQVIYRDVRRAILRKFPYGVFYRVDGAEDAPSEFFQKVKAQIESIGLELPSWTYKYNAGANPVGFALPREKASHSAIREILRMAYELA